MGCIRCQNLESAIEALQSEYNAALDSACYRVCRRSAAFIRVELENARNELEEHRSVCTFAVTQPIPLQAVALTRFVRQEEPPGRSLSNRGLTGRLRETQTPPIDSGRPVPPSQPSFKQTAANQELR